MDRWDGNGAGFVVWARRLRIDDRSGSISSILEDLSAHDTVARTAGYGQTTGRERGHGVEGEGTHCGVRESGTSHDWGMTL